tara:strand:- start:61 stop:1635 length:1575 start_codon:yes stop_codon:yes gene_type:complete
MLLVEYNVLDRVEVINEGTEGNTRLRLRGKFQQCDEQNNNGRIYPRKILEAQVKAIQEKIGDRSLVGALDHPANDAIHLSQASHLITGLSVGKNGEVIGECEILSTPNGKIVEALIKDGVKIGISSRGVGSVTEGIKGKIVNEDFKLITFDLVSDPSTRGAFPELTESMRENSERAQAIVSQHKKDRVLRTILESKIEEALNEKKKLSPAQKKIANLTPPEDEIDGGDLKALRSKKRNESKFPDLSGDGKVTFKDILMGRGVIKGKKKKKKKKRRSDEITGTAKGTPNIPAAGKAAEKREKNPLKGLKMATRRVVTSIADAPRLKSAEDRSKTAAGIRRDQLKTVPPPRRQRSSTEIKGSSIAEKRSFTPPKRGNDESAADFQARSKAEKLNFDRAQSVSREEHRKGIRKRRAAERRGTGGRRGPQGRRTVAKVGPAPGETGMQMASTEIFGQRVVEAYRKSMSDYDIDRQQRMGTGDFDSRTDRDAPLKTAGARKTAKVIRRKAGKARAKYIRQSQDLYGSKP